jgi:hypothetical protein
MVEEHEEKREDDKAHFLSSLLPSNSDSDLNFSAT